MRLTGCATVLGVWLAACGGDSDVGGDDLGSTSADAGSSSTSSGTPPGTTISTSGVSATTEDSTTTTTTTDAESTSDTTAGGESSSDGRGDGSSSGCTPGELACACDDGACGDELECIDDVCSPAPACKDDAWGDITTEETAHYLGEINDNDDNGGNVMGMLTGPDDVDWFRYDGTDAFLNNVDPFRSIAASAGVRFCKFALCPDGIGDTDFPCEDGSVATTSPEGLPGCCADDVLHVPDAVCGSSAINDDSMAIWIRVDQAEDACVSYAFDYHF